MSRSFSWKSGEPMTIIHRQLLTGRNVAVSVEKKTFGANVARVGMVDKTKIVAAISGISKFDSAIVAIGAHAVIPNINAFVIMDIPTEIFPKQGIFLDLHCGKKTTPMDG